MPTHTILAIVCTLASSVQKACILVCLGFLISMCAALRPVMAVAPCENTEAARFSFSQLGLEPNHTGSTAQPLLFLEELCRVKRSDTQTSSNFSNYCKRVLKLPKTLSSFSKVKRLQLKLTNNLQTPTK